MKPISLLLVCILTGITWAQNDTTEKKGEDAKKWETKLKVSATMTLSAFSENWDGGESSNLAWASKLESRANRQFTPKIRWENIAKLEFGQAKTKDKDAEVWSVPEKTTDLIDLETILKLTLPGFAAPFLSVRFISQFKDGIVDKSIAGSDFPGFNPLTAQITMGISAEIIKKDKATLQSRLGLGNRNSINRFGGTHSNPAYAEDTTKPVLEYYRTIDSDFGAELITELNIEKIKGIVDFNSKLTIYEAIISSEAEDLEELADDNPRKNWWRHPDVNWENTLDIRLLKFVTLNVTYQLLYDIEISTEIRQRQILAAGFVFEK